MKKKSFLVWGILVIIFLGVFSGLYYIFKNTMFLTILMCTPAVSVVLAKLICKENFRDLYLKPNFKKNLKWYLATYFLTPVVAYAGAVVYFLIFSEDFDLLGSKFAMEAGIIAQEDYIAKLFVMIPLAVMVNPLMGMIQCFGEELAWRGFLLPKLSEKFETQTAVILNGFIWGVWHIPIIAMGYNYGTKHPVWGIFAMILLCIVLGIISSFLFYKTKSVWCPVIFHAAVNGIDLYTPSSLFMSKAPNVFIGPDLLGVVGGVGFIILAVVLFIKLKRIR